MLHGLKLSSSFSDFNIEAIEIIIFLQLLKQSTRRAGKKSAVYYLKMFLILYQTIMSWIFVLIK